MWTDKQHQTQYRAITDKRKATFVYKKTEIGGIINTETLQQELEQVRQLNR